MSDNKIEFTEEHIKAIAVLETKVDKLEDDIGCLNRIDKSIEKLSILMEVQVKENEKRDCLLVKMSDSLDNLNTEIKHTNMRIDGLEYKFKSSEDMNFIDIREINKEKAKEKLSLKEKAVKFGIPFGAISGFVVALYEILKGIKFIK
jgi:predicted RNase H-like nuclease (RuvC/YqgF family)